MIIIDKTLISNDIIEKKFTCEISRCKGGCCVKGDIGAPLENDEVKSCVTKLENNNENDLSTNVKLILGNLS